MAEREVNPRLPTSGQILGALVSRLGIKHHLLQNRTARRYFTGDPERLVKDSTREEIIGAIAQVLTDSGFVESPQEREANYKSAPILASMLQWHADHWDLTRSFLRRRTIGVLPGNLSKVWEAYVRLAVVDLAFRVAAHLHLAGSSPSALEFLRHIDHKGRGEYLNEKRRQAGLTLEDLAAKVNVDDHTVDSWMYKGTRPTDHNLARTAEVMANNTEGSMTSDIALELRALYWVSDVAALLSEHIGSQAVDDAIGRLHRYAESTYRAIDDRLPAENRAEDLTVLADWGVGSRLAEPLLSALIEQERDDEWREDLRPFGIDWIRRVLSVNLGVHLAEVDDRIKKTEGRLLENWEVRNPDAYAHYRRSQEFQMQGRLHEALAEVEIAARLDPLDPANHFTLGSVKTGIGIGRGDTALVDEGLSALWIAAKLDPTWIVPWTEIGSTLHHTGRSVEAVEHLRNVNPECGPLDSRYHSTLGTACWKLGQLPEALAAFEASLELDPEETSALLAASEIALLVGDHEKHRRYLRRARHFGADEGTLEFWELLREFGQKDQDQADTAKHDRKIAVMDAVIKLNPADADAYFTRGVSHFARERDDLAIADVDTAIRLDPDHAGAYMFRGILLANQSQWDRVIADMSEFIRLRPDDAKAYYHRAQAYGEQDNLDHALADMYEAIRLDPEHADAYRVRADCHRYKGEYDKAIADFGAALQLDPKSAAAHLGRGAAYRSKGDPDRAIADYDATIRLSPREPLAYRFRADAHLAKANYEQAISDCSKALNLSSDDPIAYFTRANAHLFSGELKLALSDFNAASEIDPTGGRYIYGRGLVHELMGDAEGAEADYRRARDLGYNIEEVD